MNRRLSALAVIGSLALVLSGCTFISPAPVPSATQGPTPTDKAGFYG
ncbi:hypothetical protein [Salinibacterium sp.]|nr:hypothetical protein [Salinibacterium sp.]